MHVYRAFLVALLPLVTGVFVDEAYKVDFHYALLGQPQISSTFFHQPVKGSKASLLYSLSDKSVLGAVNPKDGAILWRQVLWSNKTTGPGFLAVGDEQDALVSASGSRVTSWTAADGRLVWDKEFGHNLVRSLAVDQSSNDAFVVVQGATTQVHKLGGPTGSLIWTSEDTSGDIPYRILHTPTNVYLISLHSTLLKGLKLRVTSIDATSGKVTDQQSLSSEGDVSAPKDIVFAGLAAGQPIVAWADAARKTLKMNILGTKDIRSFDASTGDLQIESITLHASNRPNAAPQILAHYQASDAHWADVFEIDPKKLNVRKLHSLPTVRGRGAFSVNAVEDNVYFVRITEDQLVLLPASSGTAIGSWPSNFKLSGFEDQPVPVHATSEVVIRSGSNHAVRAAVLLSSGDWVLIRNGVISWVRPEALAGIVNAYFAGEFEDDELAEELKIESSSNLLASYVHRALRHLNDLQNSPTWLQSLISTSINKLSVSGAQKSADTDTFGFNKLLMAETDNGRLISLDMGDRGKMVWNKPYVTQLQQSPPHASDRKTQEHHSSQAIGYSLENGLLRGHKTSEKSALWSFTPSPGYTIKSVTPQLSYEPIASIGKVLGDRTVLYKYLNPNAVIVMSVDEQNGRAVATLLDTVSGNVLYTSQHEHVDTSRPIATAISENWMSFSYTVDSPLDSVSKGFQLIMAEFYESDLPNDRGYFDIASNYSAIRGSSPPSKPYVVSQSFHVPEEICHMAVTQTGQGITSRQLLVGLSGSNAIVGIPRYVLDPRRTIGKDPTTAQLEEGLSRYAPMVDFDPTWYLNHREEIFGVEQIMTTPSLLESTSIVIAFGHDVFGTRVSPSFAFDILGNSFNKIQLILTVLALLVGVFVVAPLIQRKQTNALWQAV